MAELITRHVVDKEGLSALLTPRDDFIVAERLAPDDSFLLEHGPFDHYERHVTSSPAADGNIVVTERINFRLATPAWRILLSHPVRRSLRTRPAAADDVPWWAPPDRFDTGTARAVSLLCLTMIVTGYLGAVIGQTATFAADEFGASDRAQGFLFAAVRLGTLLTVVVTTLADRKGRKRLLLLALVTGILMTATGAASTGMVSLGATQAVARGMATAIALLVGIMAAETAPRNSRAYVAAVLSLTAGLGAGMVVWILPLAGLGIQAWRILYVVPVIALPFTWWLAKHLKESDRFKRHLEQHTGDAKEAMLRSRLILVAAVAFLVLLFAAPASQFRNEFLRDERGFSAAQLSLFVLVTNTPVGIGVAIAGKLADRRGRRPVGAFAVFGGTVFTLATYASDGWGMWTASIFASVIGAMAAPALGVYSAEMFGTARRGRANGIVSLVGLGGSAIGLLLVGDLSERLGSFSAAFSVVAIGPLIVVVLVLALFPETAKRELEDINPGDKPDFTQRE